MPSQIPAGSACSKGAFPSKTLLHAAKLINETADAQKMGLTFQPPQLDLDQLRNFKNGVVGKLTGGLGVLKTKRKVNFVRGHGTIESPHTLVVELQEGGRETIEFESLIIATGSAPARLPFVDYTSPHVWDSTAALELREIPPRLLVIGGGYIGMELGTVYAALGSQVTVVEVARIDHCRRGSRSGGARAERRQETIPRRAGRHARSRRSSSSPMACT